MFNIFLIANALREKACTRKIDFLLLAQRTELFELWTVEMLLFRLVCNIKAMDFKFLCPGCGRRFPYDVSVISTLLYGCEAWTLSAQARRKLSGTVPKMLSRITGRTIADEARKPTLDVVMRARDRRWNWLGHVLRLEEHRVITTSTYELRQANSGLESSVMFPT